MLKPQILTTSNNGVRTESAEENIQNYCYHCTALHCYIAQKDWDTF